DPRDPARRAGRTDACGRAHRMGRVRDAIAALARRQPRPVRDRRGRRRAAGLGRDRRSVHLAVSPAGDSVQPQNCLRTLRTRGADRLLRVGRAQMKSRLSIETPEGITFSFELATPITRALAWSVDAAAIGTLSFFIGRITGAAGVLSAD